MRFVRLTPLVTGLALLLPPSGASAQEEGVVVDPDSPAGKEYAVPLESARRQGSGGEQGSGGTTRFGEGISQPTTPPAGAGPGATPDRDGNRSQRRERRRRAQPEDELSSGPTAGASDGGGGGGGDDDSATAATLLTGGIALAVLLIGGAVALIVRRSPAAGS
jgi:hypothetical protein